MSNIVFIGFRGVGKTTLATALAEQLQRPLLSTDTLIEATAGQSIREYVQLLGWPAFRTIERTIVQSLAHTRDAIIDCGGGVVEQADVMTTLSTLGTIVWVDAELDDIYHRLQNNSGRPLLSANDLQSDIGTNYTRRRPLYAQYSSVYVNTSHNSVAECIQYILNGIQTDKI